VGLVIRPRGIAGEVIVKPLSDHPSRFEAGAQVWLGEAPMTIARARPDGPRWVLLFEGVASREAAEALRGRELLVDSSYLPPLDEGSYYLHDLIGCRIEDSGGTRLGTVTGVVPGAPGWLEIDDEGRNALIPMVRTFLREVDLEAQRIVIDPPAGLIEASATVSKAENDAL
jgi:16S rRNA processing protein RimM